MTDNNNVGRGVEDSTAGRSVEEHAAVNIPLLRKAVEWVESQADLPYTEKEWFQGDWVYHKVLGSQEMQQENSCGTAYCVAGYIGQMLDEQFKDSAWRTDENGKSQHVSEFAAEALGLDSATHVLFNGSNNAETIRRIAEEIAGEPL